MTRLRLWSIANLYLLLAGTLSAALLAAPIAYASNFGSGLHVTVHGAWAHYEQSLGHGMIAPRTETLWQLPLQWPYAGLAVAAAACALVAIALNRTAELKQRWIGRVLMLAFVHVFYGLVLRFFVVGYVGQTDLPDGLDAGFHREFLFHLFVLYSCWRAWSRIGAVADAPAAASEQPK